MDQLVGDDARHPLLVVGGRLLLVVQQVVLSVRDQAPILHGTRPKIRDGDLIWIMATKCRQMKKAVSDFYQVLRWDVNGF